MLKLGFYLSSILPSRGPSADGKLKCSDAEECPAQTDFVLGEPTEEFLASMNAYDAAIASAYNNPITNLSLDHYKFPKVALPL